MTAAVLAQLICMTSGAFGPAWSASRCAEHAGWILSSAERHHVDPVLMVAVNAYECDMHDRDAPIYRQLGNRRTLVGFDRCPMGMRVLGLAQSARLGPAELYEMAGVDLERSFSYYREKHLTIRDAIRKAVARRNSRSRNYADQVLAVAAALGGRRPSVEGLTERTKEIVRRLCKIFRKVS